MLRKILVFILCLSLITPVLPVEAYAAESQVKYLSVRRLNDGFAKTYEVITDGENVYIELNDLIEVVGYYEKIVDMTGNTINQIILTKKKDRHGYDQDIVIIPEKKKITSAWYGEDEFDGCLNLEEGIYIDIVQIFNYLRVKAEVLNDELLINIPVYSVLDFMIYDYQAVLRDSVSQLDLLEAQESSFSSGFFDALSLACNNFDFRLLVPIWGSNEIKNEQYTKAIQTLNEEDEIFYSEDTSEFMKNELSERGLKGILAAGTDLLNVMSIGGQTIETVEDVLRVMENVPEEKLNQYMNLINWNGKTYDGFIDLKAWNQHTGTISDALSFADIVVSAYEAYKRADSWNEECLEDLEVLKGLDVNNYGDHKEYVKRIKKVAAACYQESANAGKSASDQVVKDVSGLLLEKAITSTSVYGQVVDYFILAVNTGVSIAKCFGNVAEEMDKAELSYMVTCLINVAVAARIDAEIEYDKLDLSDLNSGEINEFRDSMRTAIKSNLRCWSYIYYLNRDGKWENTYRGKEVKEKINKMNLYLTLLKESEQYDYALDEDDLITYSPKRIVEILKTSEEVYQVDNFPMEEGYYRSDGDDFYTDMSIIIDENGVIFLDLYYTISEKQLNDDIRFKYNSGTGTFEQLGISDNKRYYTLTRYDEKDHDNMFELVSQDGEIDLYNIQFWKRNIYNRANFILALKEYIKSGDSKYLNESSNLMLPTDGLNQAFYSEMPFILIYDKNQGMNSEPKYYVYIADDSFEEPGEASLYSKNAALEGFENSKKYLLEEFDLNDYYEFETAGKYTESKNDGSEPYTNEQLCELARSYYEKHFNNVAPENIVVSTDNGDEVMIHLYDDTIDATMTYDWYTVNRYTARGTNLAGEEIDLNDP